MSEQEAPIQPIEQPAEPLSQSEIVRQELAKYIDAGHDLTIKETRTAVCKEIAANLKIEYKNVSKYVHDAVRKSVKKAAGSESFKRNLGSATVEVETPAPIPQEPEPQPEQQSAAPIQPAQPEKPRFETQEELMASKEFKTIRMQLDMVFLGIDQVYGFLGINMLAAKQDPQIKAMFGAQMDGIAAYCVEEGIQMPKWAALLVVASGIGGIYIPPLLHKLGIVDFSGKKKDDKKTDKPIAPPAPM